MSDENLLKAMENDDASAFEAIYRRYWRELFVFVCQQIASKEEAKEILQDLMLSLWQNRRTSNIRNLKAFLFISARNQINMYLRREINIRKYTEYQLMREVFETAGADYALNERELMSAIDKALDKLPEKTAHIFRLSKMENQSIDKIAICMGLSDKAVKYHLTKSMKLVREHLQHYVSAN